MSTALRTPLYDEHTVHKARFVHFAGYDMPIQYEGGILKEHEWVRSNCGLFDVSHMGQVYIRGDNLASLFSYITPSNFAALQVGACKYTVLLNDNGGIIDDLIVTKFAEDEYFAVFNASRKAIDLSVVKSNISRNQRIEEMFTSRSLIAIQGCISGQVLSGIFPEIEGLGYMRAIRFFSQQYGHIIITRTGYTGELGYEVSVENVYAVKLWRELLGDAQVRPIGLGARDGLRIEMGYPLYGNDIDDTTTPIEAGIGFVVSPKVTGYIGHDVVSAEKAAGFGKKKRLGVEMLEKGVLRHGNQLMLDGVKIGVISSGCFSPILGKSIGHCYVTSNLEDTFEAQAEIRDKLYPVKIRPFPFIQSRVK